MVKQSRYTTDGFAKNLARALLEDFDLAHEYPMGHIREWKMQHTPLDAYEFKKHVQITELFKKYTFEKDVFTPVEIEAMTIQKFMDCQVRLANHNYELTPSLKEVVFRARGWIDRVLQDYDLTEHLECCYFPKKASVGTPLREATLEHRWLEGLTGSREHLEWFDRVYKPWHSHSASEFGRIGGSGKQQHPPAFECTELRGTLVDKTFKSKRFIVPNTAIGGLYTNGLGDVLVRRLKGAGYDVSTLPGVHARLARIASLYDRIATVDQTSASDNITKILVRLLLPFRWARALEFGRLSDIRIGNTLIHCETFSTMGIGFTFPLQMLIFLGLTHAVLDLWEETNRRRVDTRVVSAFGDDLICPVEIRDELESVFTSLGLQINREKTFWSGPFKESCGSDYYRGFDVRPFFVPTGGKSLSRKSFEAYLYKTFNAVKRRWSLDEVPRTLNYILREVSQLRMKPFVVPLHFGDDTGLKLDHHEAVLLGLDRTPNRDVHGTYTFHYLRKQPEKTEVKFHACYYWGALQEGSRFAARPRAVPRTVADSIDLSCGTGQCKTPVFHEEEALDQPRNYRSKLTGKRLKKKATMVSIAGDHGSYITQTGTCFNWSSD